MASQTPVGLLSREERLRAVDRAAMGLYRWYVEKSQSKRDWRVDSSFPWRNLRTDHDSDILLLIEGFFAVEQYVPDFTAKGINLLRSSYARSQFQIKWGAEESKHADLWRNGLLFAARWSPERLNQYESDLRANSWELPWEDPIRIIFYTVFQELATKLNYANLARLASGQGSGPNPERHTDPVLLQMCRTIVADEAAHYAFYLEIARVLLYYVPAEALEAIEDVLREFSMPAQDIIPNWSNVQEAILRTGVYGPRTFFTDVLQVALGQLTLNGRKAVRDGIRKMRMVPTEDGDMRDTVVAGVLDVPRLTADVRRAYERVRKHEEETGLWEVDPTILEPGPLNALVLAACETGLR